MWHRNKKLKSELNIGDGRKIGSKAPKAAGKKIYLADKGSGAKKTSIQIKIEANQNIHVIAVEKPNCIPLSANQLGNNAPAKLITVNASIMCFVMREAIKDECELKETPRKIYPNEAKDKSKT